MVVCQSDILFALMVVCQSDILFVLMVVCPAHIRFVSLYTSAEVFKVFHKDCEVGDMYSIICLHVPCVGKKGSVTKIVWFSIGLCSPS